jgi:integrase
MKTNENGVTVAELVKAFLADQRHDLTVSTFEDRRRVTEQFAEAFGPRPAMGIRPSEVKAWILGNRAWRKASTRWAKLLAVKRLFNWAANDGLLDKTPIRGLHLPQGDPRRAVTEAEFQSMLRGTTPVFRRFLLFLRLTGCRPGEAAALRWRWVDWDLGAVFLPPDEHKTGHTTRKPRMIVLPAPALKLLRWMRAQADKAKDVSQGATEEWLLAQLSSGPVKAAEVSARAKAIGISERMLHVARKRLGVRCKRVGFGGDGYTIHLLDEPRGIPVSGKRTDDHVFRSSRGAPWTRGGLAKRLEEIRNRTGIPLESTFHGIRHLFATVGVACGGNLKLLSAALGHASTSITEKFYVNLDHSHIEAMRAIATAAGQRTKNTK